MLYADEVSLEYSFIAEVTIKKMANSCLMSRLGLPYVILTSGKPALFTSCKAEVTTTKATIILRGGERGGWHATWGWRM